MYYLYLFNVTSKIQFSLFYQLYLFLYIFIFSFIYFFQYNNFIIFTICFYQSKGFLLNRYENRIYAYFQILFYKYSCVKSTDSGGGLVMYLLYNSVVEAYQTVVLLKGVCKILFTNAMFKSMNIFEAFFCNICVPGGKCYKIVLDILCHFLLPITLPGIARHLVSVSHSNQHFFFLYLAVNTQIIYQTM